MRRPVPKVTVQGDPNCIHEEYIDDSNVGVCRKCGRTKDYNFGAATEQNFTLRDESPKFVPYRDSLHGVSPW